MGKIIVFTNVTLDGVMQAPGRPDEDPREGFEHGGWATPYGAMQEAGETIANMGALLLGRWTYESFYAFWPNQTDTPFTALLNNIQKYVVSTILEEPLAWSNATLLRGAVSQTVGRLKEVQDQDIVVFGSAVLTQSLMQHNLVDEYVLLIHPVVIGKGKRLFANEGTYAALRLNATKTTTTGVVIATYQTAL
ncbi:MAG: dihydrofolate reductase [Chloroflexi bacterium AL-W]|nr:dihydrofolate reductase [Chloroflexi bacterium AL-N1]NOK66088.1 dihydrofolate reductase [Chloroflexi bacterium AL-N10]NOK79866.1 dihydrofolate reductase [Chloroflexi bacterium AL-W]NOK88278.1 dihydrofolate reductase [Chloroflexi bacterium AL-N15]